MLAVSSASTVTALLLLLVAAPLVPGIVTRTKAVVTGRRGAPVWQLYADLWKLGRRGAVYSTTTSWMFPLAPVVLVVSTVAAATLLPLDGRNALVRFSGDALLFAYLLALGRFTLVLAAFDTGSSFEVMGASRDVAFAALIEVGVFTGLLAAAIATHQFTLSTMFGEPARGAVGPLSPAALMLAASFFVLTLAECARVPVDDPATHLELTMIHEVMVLDHSGPDFALIQYAGALKMSVFAALTGLALGSGTWSGWAGVGTLAASLVVVGIAIGIVESSVARLRLPKVPLYLASGSALALFALILELLPR